MGNFNEAVRALILSQRICPRCKAQNIPRATPTIVQEQDGSLGCACCGHNWVPKDAP